MQRTVRNNFHALAEDFWVTVDASKSLDAVTEEVQTVALNAVERFAQAPVSHLQPRDMKRESAFNDGSGNPADTLSTRST